MRSQLFRKPRSSTSANAGMCRAEGLPPLCYYQWSPLIQCFDATDWVRRMASHP